MNTVMNTDYRWLQTSRTVLNRCFNGVNGAYEDVYFMTLGTYLPVLNVKLKLLVVQVLFLFLLI